jgi:hypothetical protein
MRLKLILVGISIAAALITVFLLFTRAPTHPIAYVQGPDFPGRRQYEYLAVDDSTKTGFECIYLVKSYEYDPSENLEGQRAVLAKIQRSLEKVAIPAGQLFDIVAVVRATAPEGIAALKKEYLKVRLMGSCDGSPFETFSTDVDVHVFESSGYGTSRGYLRANVIFDNAGDRYLLSPGQTLRIEYLKLEVVK